ncbi:cytochrome C biogenesis protein, partial [Vibrio parahaemolyticus]|nr:cytochrome C biogenesis protein [Vibrio parahaemolyticus]
CVLTDYQIQLTFLPSDLKVDEDVMFSYAQAVSNVPQPSPFIDVTQASWDANQSKLQIKLQNSQGWQQPQVLVDGVDEATRDYSFKLEGMHPEGNIVTASYIVDTWLGDVELDGQSLFVTIKDTNLLAEETTQATAEAIVEPL